MCWKIQVLKCLSASSDQKQEKQYNENKEKDFRNAGSISCNTGKSKYAGYYGYNEKNIRPA